MALTDLLTAGAVGIAFGFALERAGLGSARKLTGQFFLTDLTVFKVMFSAIVTAMLGTFWLGRLGLMDLAFLYVPETYLGAQIAGGLIFGAGFALAGLCPGTSCVSAATGRGDGAMVVAGMFAGVLATGLAFPLVERLYNSGAHGAWTLPQLLQLPYGVVVFGVVLIALVGFAAAEWIEWRNAGPTRSTLAWPRIAHGGLIVLTLAALALGAASALVRTPAPARALTVSAPAPAEKPRVRPASGC
jgi:uncharacterized protein